MIDIIIGIVIAGGCFFAVRKKYRDMKKGKYCGCGCGCEDCPHTEINLGKFPATQRTETPGEDI